ncbi:hypothetical protein PAXRUDRAFT_201854 [Paxillus rubicundulus Ve08.2h10]|uniref:Uncharacterized protein n=1 Tax=Paxillus rubicundulus Ve08.2h10 TaxID=930991 RepID=A0A0D0DI05_9AGAM|nr:hypothetical protein PAXRUDRAFT_201854 [Paxillus rubicundulus Ve08.2h10]
MTDNSAYLSGKIPISEFDITAENDLRMALNLTLQAQRDAGVINVDNDLPLLPLPTTSPSFSVPEQILTAFTLLSPTSKTSVSSALSKTQPPPDINPPPPPRPPNFFSMLLMNSPAHPFPAYIT